MSIDDCYDLLHWKILQDSFSLTNNYFILFKIAFFQKCCFIKDLVFWLVTQFFFIDNCEKDHDLRKKSNELSVWKLLQYIKSIIKYYFPQLHHNHEWGQLRAGFSNLIVRLCNHRVSSHWSFQMHSVHSAYYSKLQGLHCDRDLPGACVTRYMIINLKLDNLLDRFPFPSAMIYILSISKGWWIISTPFTLIGLNNIYFSC